MNEIERINTQITRAFDGGAWHGPSLAEILDGVDDAAAAARPLPGAHSIREIVLHLIGTQNLLLARLRGEALELSPEDDWPPVTEAGDGAWKAVLDALSDGDRRIRELVSSFPPARLDEPLVPGGSLAYENFHGYVQHNLYHAGQIAILKKSLSSPTGTAA